MNTPHLRVCATLLLAAVCTLARADIVFAVNEGVTYRVPNEEIRARYAAIATDLSKLLKQPVQIEPVADYPSLRKGLADKAYDLALVHPAHLSIEAIKKSDYKLLAVTKGFQDYKASFLVGADSPLKSLADLKGKKLGVPFVSTTHFHTMFALEQWGIKASDVQLLNMQPNQIAAAWERGDIDAAYVWDPALARIKQSGKVLITSGELSKKGKATFDGIAVQKKWGEQNADFMAKFVKAIGDADASYRSNPAQWGADSANAKAIASKIGGEAKDAAEAIKLYGYPSIEQQASAAWLGGGKAGGAVKALVATSEFLKEQKRIDALAPDYSAFVTPKYAEAALKLK